MCFPHGRRLAPLVACLAALLVAGPARASTPAWPGRWRVDVAFRDGASILTLTQRGSTVTGSFPFQVASDKGFGGGFCYTGKGGRFKGAVRGRRLRGALRFRTQGHRRSTASFAGTLSPDGRRLFSRGEMLTGECGSVAVYLVWNGTKLS